MRSVLLFALILFYSCKDGRQFIYVFSLTGEPLTKYILDRYIYGISVDEERGIITATDVNSDEPIVVFKM